MVSLSARALLLAASLLSHVVAKSLICNVPASGSNTTDDAPAVIAAFDKCGKGGKVVFSNTTYHINSVMKVLDLQNCEIDIQGKLLWSQNITYWLGASMDIGYQNQSTAFMLGGNNVTLRGNGRGTFDGNGDVWYTFVHGQSNYPKRPHQLTLWGLNSSTVEGLRFVQSQMWTMSILYSHNTTFNSIYINSTSSTKSSTSNTDGVDTFFSSNLTFSNFRIVNGDDSISTKANSTDITIKDSYFERGLGVAVGSIGQYLGRFETIERVKVENVTFNGTLHAVYFKTWTGEAAGYPPNGGGGGLGYATNITANDLTYLRGRGAPFTISQCTAFGGTGHGNCTSSQFQIRDLDFRNIHGDTTTSQVASFQCSGVAPCENIRIEDVELKVTTGNATGQEAGTYLCGNVVGTTGWKCTGAVCVGGSATGGC